MFMNNLINIYDMIDYIENDGKLYTMHFKDGSILKFTEEQFKKQNEIHQGRLTIKLI